MSRRDEFREGGTANTDGWVTADEAIIRRNTGGVFDLLLDEAGCTCYPTFVTRTEPADPTPREMQTTDEQTIWVRVGASMTSVLAHDEGCPCWTEDPFAPLDPKEGG